MFHSRALSPTLAAIYLTLVFWSGLFPAERDTWLLEHLVVAMALLVLWHAHNHVQFSAIAQVGIVLTLCIHSIGAHYTYSLTPYDSFFGTLLGVSINDLFGWQRNNYDRIVHFVYGFCLAPAFKETVAQWLKLNDARAHFIAANLILSTSLLYELIEWGAAEIFGGDLGMAYLGAQGDIWDAHADMALAGAGWLLAYLLSLCAALRLNFVEPKAI